MVRPAVLADLPILGRLGALLVRIHHGFDPTRFIAAPPQSEELYAAFLGEQLERPDVVVLVAERVAPGQRDDVVGYAYGAVEGADYTTLRGPAGVCHDLVVDPAHRRLGIGRALLDGMLSALAARGAPRGVLMTAEPNAPAQWLFARAGFRRTMIEMTRDLDTDAS